MEGSVFVISVFGPQLDVEAYAISLGIRLQGLGFSVQGYRV